VECIPLICGSILSKKLAEGIDALILDVKFGRGAFMKTRGEARELAQALVNVGRAGGKNVRALLTAMHEPLGRAVGNAVEVAESIACMRGEGPADLNEVTFALGAQMLQLGGVAKNESEAREQLKRVIANGAALKKFREIVEAQGGDARVIDEPARLPQAGHQIPLAAARSGFVSDVDAMGVALASLRLGAGRAKAEDKIDPAVGVSALVKMGEKVERGAPLCVIHANSEASAAEARVMLEKAIVVGDEPGVAPKLVEEMIG
jgi:thymidine phosphorylase